MGAQEDRIGDRSVDRRTFVKAVGAAGAALAMGASSSRGEVAPTGRRRYAIVGVGIALFIPVIGSIGAIALYVSRRASIRTRATRQPSTAGRLEPTGVPAVS